MERYAMDVEIVNLDPEFRMYMTEEEDRRKCFNSEISIATKKGMEKGLERGMKKGIKKGIKQKAIETIKRMLEDNVPVENIAKYTQLSIEEVEKLKTKKK